MIHPERKLEQSAEPMWVAILAERLQQMRLLLDDEHEASALALALQVPHGWLRTITRALAVDRGLHGVHAFVRGAVYDPGGMLRNWPRLNRVADDEQEVRRLLGFGLAMVDHYRMRSYFYPVLYLSYNRGELAVELVADLLSRMVGTREALDRIVGKLRTRDADLRQFLLQLVATLASVAEFARIRPQLDACYQWERNLRVREAYELLFELAAPS